MNNNHNKIGLFIGFTIFMFALNDLIMAVKNFY